MKIIDNILIFFGLKENKKPIQKQKKIYTKEEQLERAMRSGDETALALIYYEESKKQGFYSKRFFIPLVEENKPFRKLSFNFIPKNQANKNVRSYLQFKTGDYKKWQRIRNDCEEISGFVCSVCRTSAKTQGKKYNTECHENWEFGTDENKEKVQRLESLKSLCFTCHQIKHCNNINEKDELLTRYAEINKISIFEAIADYNTAIKELEEKNQYKYSLDLSILEEHKIKSIDRYFDCNTQEFKEFLKEFVEAE